MTISFKLIRLFFIALSALILSFYLPAVLPGGLSAGNVYTGLIFGIGFALAIIFGERLLRYGNLKTFIVMSIGLFFGTLLGEGIYSLVSILPLEKEVLGLLHISLLLGSAYCGMMLSAWSSDEIALSIPFILLKTAGQKKKDLILDLSILTDPRIIDLANSGLVDNHLVLPRFLVKEIQTLGDAPKAKKALEAIKKLENIPGLGLRIIETDYSEIKNISDKLVKLARSLDANILSADINRVQQAEIQGVKIININLLANGLKPITQSGEQIEIKVQRYGKEPRQGVGYLEDGTMVVVNGGADFMGETVVCNVLSVKHTGTGRLIFCNAPDEADKSEPSPSQYFVSDYETVPK
ncbi:MAG: TRAM domain-containing protein [Chlamydiia bacterium]|nr:TRAM domain-containing protein [Chlamydiia bacterium]